MPFSNKRNSRNGQPNRVKRTNSLDKFSTNRKKDERPDRKTDSRNAGSSRNFSNDQSTRPFDKNRTPRKSYGKPSNVKGSDSNEASGGRDIARRDKFQRNHEKDGRIYKKDGYRNIEDSKRPSGNQSTRPFNANRDTKSFGRFEGTGYGDKRERTFGTEDGRGSKGNVDSGSRKRNDESRPFRKREGARPYSKDAGDRERRSNTFNRDGGQTVGDARSQRPNDERKVNRSDRNRDADDKIRLNRYIANSGVCSRRKADELIEAGVVSVNGEVVTALGTKVDPAKDEVRYNGERLKREKMVYVLLNKPKDYITTTDDPQERRTVMQLVEKASRERIYPVGRLDRNTTGLLLMTNDGDLADKLSHPKNSITKIYHVELDKNLTQGDLNKIGFGLELEDGLIKPDTVSYVQGGSKREVGIQIHSGRNRIVRRIFEHLGYDVIKLDRVIYANLTKKDLPRGRWRYLEEREVVQLKHFIK